MTDVVVPVLVGFGTAFAVIAFNWLRVAFERRQRRRTLVAALVAEATNHGASLWRLLHEYPKSESLAVKTNQFYRAAMRYQTAGDVFLAHLRSADVIEPEIVRKFADTYGELRAAGLEAGRLAEVGSVNIARRIRWAFQDRLAGIAGQLREAVSLLENSR